MEQLHASALHERNHPRASVAAAIGSLDLQPGQRVLDAGCGPGAHIELFAQRVEPGGRVVGLDISQERLAIAAELNAERIDNGLAEVREGDLHALPFADGIFDIGWMSAVLHHEAEPVEVVRMLARVVRAGGRVAVLDGDGGGSFPLLAWEPEFELRLRAAALRAEQDRYGDTLPYTFRSYLGRRLPEILAAAGLEAITLHAFSDVVRAPLGPLAEAELCHWFLGSFAKRIQDYLVPTDLMRLTAHFTPGTDSYLPAQSQFFLVRTSYLCIGVCPS